MQPCLIELRQLDGTVKLIDALTVLPSASWKEVVDPIYAAYLNLIGHEYKSDIEQDENQPDIAALAAKRCSDPPFMCAAVTPVRQRIFAATETRGLEGHLSPPVRQEVEELIDNVRVNIFGIRDISSSIAPAPNGEKHGSSSRDGMNGNYKSLRGGMFGCFNIAAISGSRFNKRLNERMPSERDAIRSPNW